MRDVLDLYPLPAEDTADVVDQAIATLAQLRGLDPDPDTDPAVRLHLLVSIGQQLQADTLTAVLTAHHHGYTQRELAVLLVHA